MNKNKNSNRVFTRILISAAAVSAVLALAIACLVYEASSEPLPVDTAVRDWFVSARGDFLNEIIVILTHCGDTVTIVALCTALLILPGRKAYGLPVSLAALGGVAIYKPMKHFFLRARPEEAIHLVEQGGYSFPSGHSVSSVIVYGLLLYLIRKRCKNETLKTVLSAVCACLALLIGPSRLYVGVHWATDVSCGMLIGAAALAISILILERMDDKHESLR